MADLTVLLAPDGPEGGVLEVLADLSGAGLVDPFLWVSGSDVTPSSALATAVERGRRRVTTVQESITDRDYDRVRLCVVVPLGADAPLDVATEQLLSAAVSFAGGRARVTRVRCLVGRPGMTGAADDVARPGWHNVLVAPEDAYGPGLNRITLDGGTDPVEIGRYAAPTIAGLLGLWSGADRCCLDDMPVPPGQTVRAARGFYRRVDASGLERSLRRQVLATEPRLPQPSDHTGQTVYVEDVAGACRAMAAALWEKHRSALIGPRVAADPGVVTPMGWMTALRWLWGFIWAALKRAPEDWYRAKVAQAAAGLARGVHERVFGSGSAYAVVVNGRTADGMAADWRDIGSASGELAELLDPQHETAQQPASDLTPLWKDFAGGALTLADAGGRGGAAMPPVQSGPHRAVVESVEDCVPGPDHDFTDVSGQMGARTQTPRVQAGDVLGADLLRRRLEPFTRDPSLGSEAGRILQSLTAWATGLDRSYGVQFGKILAGQQRKVLEEIQYYLDKLRAAAASDAEAESERRQRVLARIMRVLAVVAVVVLVAAGVLYGYGTIGLLAAVITAAVTLVVWALSSFVIFAQGQRELFRELTRRRMQVSENAADLANLRQAIRDLRRLGEAYEQYLVWTRIVGTVLRRPYGPEPAATADGAAIVRGLPRSTRVARADQEELPLARVAAALRTDLFSPGWLSMPWERHLNDAAARLGVRGYELNGRPGGIVDLRGGPVRGSLLEAWSEVLVREGTAAAIGDETWAGVMGLLEGPRSALVASLLSSVQGLGRADHLPVPLQEFLCGIDSPGPTARGQEFSAEHFTAAARTAERLKVDVHADSQSHVGLSRVVVLVQLTEARPPWDFEATETGLDRRLPPVPAIPVISDGPDDGVRTPQHAADREHEWVPTVPEGGVF